VFYPRNYIINGDIFVSSFLSVYLCIHLFSVFFFGREGQCLSEPEFCVSFVKELGESNLVSLCKVTPS